MPLNSSNPAASSLFVFNPVNEPRKAVGFTSAGPGILIANSSLKRIMSAVCRCGCTTMPTVGGSIASGVVQAMGAAFDIPRHEVVTIATGPGFKRRLASVTSQSRRVTIVAR